MGFVLGFMMGLVGAVILFGVAAWWVCSRSDSVAVAKFINGIAQALAHRPKTSQPATAGKKVEKEVNNEPERKTDTGNI